MLQGTWSGPILLDLALRLLFTVAGGYLIVDDTVVAKPYARRLGEAAWVWSNKDRQVLFGVSVVLPSGQMARSAFPSPSACGTKGTPPRMTWPLNYSVMRAIGSSVSPLLSSLTPGTPRRSS